MAGDTQYTLSEQDALDLAQMLREWRGGVINTVNRQAPVHAIPPASSSYLALAINGIPACQGAVPGLHTCAIYRTDPTTNQPAYIGRTEMVYNYYSYTIPQNKYVPITKDRHGAWMVASSEFPGMEVKRDVFTSGTGDDVTGVRSITFAQGAGFQVTNLGSGQVFVSIFPASATINGIMTNSAQSFSGNKTFNDNVIIKGASLTVYNQSTGAGTVTIGGFGSGVTGPGGTLFIFDACYAIPLNQLANTDYALRSGFALTPNGVNEGILWENPATVTTHPYSGGSPLYAHGLTLFGQSLGSEALRYSIQIVDLSGNLLTRYDGQWATDAIGNIFSGGILSAVGAPSITGTGAFVKAMGGTLVNPTLNNPTLNDPSLYDAFMYQLFNGDTIITGQRSTDTSPTGNFIEFLNAAGVPIFLVDINGKMTQGTILDSIISGNLDSLGGVTGTL